MVKELHFIIKSRAPVNLSLSEGYFRATILRFIKQKMFSPDAFVFGFIQGFVIGPISLWGIREGLNPKRGPWFHLQVTLGATVVDLLFLLLATHGVISFIDYSFVRVGMWIIASYMLISMGLDSLKGEKGKKKIQRIHRHKLHFFDSDFFKAFCMCLVSPMAITYSVMVVGGFYMGYAKDISPLAFALNINFGGFINSLLIILLTFFVRHIFHQWMLQKLMMGGSLVLVGYGIYFAWEAFLEMQPAVSAAFASLLKP